MRRLAACSAPGALLTLAVAAASPAWAADCFEPLARTRNYTLGLPAHVQPLPDGRNVLYLRSGPEDTRQRLYDYDVARHAERELAAPGAAPEHLSVEEKARRERARMTVTGITDFAVSENGSRVLVSEGDHLSTVALPQGVVTPVTGGGWIAPRLSPDGRFVAVVREHDLHVVALSGGQAATDVQVTQGGSATLTHGVAEFAAAEELDRADGAWWSPDSERLIFEAADTSAVERHFIADPLHPSEPPVEFRYPRAGTANARTRFGLIGRAGGTVTWIDLDQEAWPYVARVIWSKQAPPTLVVLNRAQTREAVLAVDPATGHTRTLLTETDPGWIDLAPMEGVPGRELPAWLPDGSGFLWAGQRGAQWQLELHRADGTLDHAVTPRGFAFLALNDVDAAHGSLVVTADPERLSQGLFRVALAGGSPAPLAASPGLHHAAFSPERHDLFTDSVSGADGQAATILRRADGSAVARLPSAAATLPRVPGVQYLRVGAQGLDADVLRPSGFVRGRKYPVVLSVYAGPTVKMVQRAPRLSLENQCLADHGFIVVSLDGRGTPGRDHDFEHATKGDLIDLPLQDQVGGLQALGRRVPEMDMHRVGVEGWSFGGYFTAMATIRRPDIFAAGVAGAPVVDFADYDTAYTERYLGTPQDDPAGYAKSNVLTYAATLSRPLLIMHGLTDDNVYFENTMKLTQALVAAGKPYRLLLLPGTHLLPDPLLRARVNEARAAFLAEELRVR
ncbi:DPP IV N-terminal domain-containing protein [Lichenicoccus sp.]|uniref:S9 family peptidase n=1 Tax=Lichenicoccus sp. TaxID=2781899 RepID=UPI003D11A8F9